jgi:hypothetical protein
MSKWQLIEAKKGDQIRVKVGSFYHHGIFIDDDNVVQFGRTTFLVDDPKLITVEKVSINEFLNSGFLEVRVFTKAELKKKNSVDEVVNLALSKLGEDGYDILKNNCEHFCNWCLFNEKVSDQIEKIYTNVEVLLRK